jgi:hypothetical protein
MSTRRRCEPFTTSSTGCSTRGLGLNAFRIALAVAITIVWSASYVIGSIQHSFTGFQVSTPVMLVVGAWLMSANYRRNGNGR